MITVPGFVNFGIAPPYERQGIYSLEEVFRWTPDSVVGAHKQKHQILFDGTLINMKSSRYWLFKRSCKCVTCDLEGRHFAMERSAKKVKGVWVPMIGEWHFNLYAVNAHGKEVLMTKDHIVPKSKGGPDRLDNYQTMCTHCNGRKGDKHVAPSELLTSCA